MLSEVGSDCVVQDFRFKEFKVSSQGLGCYDCMNWSAWVAPAISLKAPEQASWVWGSYLA